MKPEINIGDVVTWRTASTKSIQPLGFANCKVVALGETEDKQPAAIIEVMGERVGALVADLHKEPEE